MPTQTTSTGIPPRSLARLMVLMLPLLVAGQLRAAEDDHRTPAAWALMTAPGKGLRPGTRLAFGCPEATHNTDVLRRALALVPDGGTLVIPPGYFDVEYLQVVKRKNLTIRGSGMDRTTLRRKGFEWDCDTQGKCPIHTEIVHIRDSDGLVLRDLTLDGNSHHMGIKGNGAFNDQTGAIRSGCPQFPAFEGNSGFVMQAEGGRDVTVMRCRFENGFRWAVFFAGTDGLRIERSVIDTGNLSTLFRGHLDQGGKIRHAHTSQDGLHLVNCRRVQVLHNTIHSEDSGIAIEANPWWGMKDGMLSKDVEIAWNDISSGTPTNPAKVLRDRDAIYGTGLTEHYVGCGAIDIFYNENWDTANKQDISAFGRLNIHDNHLHHARGGIRVNCFTSVGPYGLDSWRHRIRDVRIVNTFPPQTAGHADQARAGIDHITIDDNPAVFNPNGGVGISIRNVDTLVVRGVDIAEVRGGIGIEIRKCTDFAIEGNRITGITGTNLSLNSPWPGGNGIRVENDPSVVRDPVFTAGVFAAGAWSISDNRIGNTAAERILVRCTGGRAQVRGNADLNKQPLKPGDIVLIHSGDGPSSDSSKKK